MTRGIMQILGLSALRHDTAAALLENGVVKVAVENDKLTRSRTRGLPEAAIRSCLEATDTRWTDLSMVSVATRPLRAWMRKTLLPANLSAVAPLISSCHGASGLGVVSEELSHLRALRRKAGSCPVITFDHHLCHAASAFFLSPFDHALILTIDEDGDGISGMLAVGEDSRIRVLRTIAFPHSPAWVYSQVTRLAGFSRGEEHKTQWLSVEGEPAFKEVLLKILRGSRGPVPHLDYSFFNRSWSSGLSFSDRFYREAGLPCDHTEMNDHQRKSLARSIQDVCCELVTELIHHFCHAHTVNQVCLAGGLFQNSLLVSALEKNLGLEHVFVPPAPGNAGTAVGAAYLAWYQLFPQCHTKPVFHVYAGLQYDRHQTKEVLDNSKARYSLQNTEQRKLEAAVNLLHAGKIVGWFQGASEFGPRALGNRSVLASPWAPYVKENLNDFIKHREWFRPFAISVPEEDCAQYFEASRQCQFLNSLGWARQDNRCLPESFLLPSCQVRLHVVRKTSNPLFWQLLKRFGERAPAPMLLNTSFNLFGEPLVVSPRDALRSYFCSGLDALIIDNFVLSKSPMHTSVANVQVSSTVALRA